MLTALELAGIESGKRLENKPLVRYVLGQKQLRRRGIL
jgi:hypothetical protein